ncbi:uncharacterized protein [Physcomitrium patens]|uniref:VWFA domain-containing protein n=1 Tax=Physcomitrium patens TaxID=3218 RepID=A9SQ90_PHYPA|nr:inter alpha-trypsin inhibitor, heavy chain 4-like [Physcomitrium patens]XP_024378445.1 inter alpha-trypsin inhibitor, heavy chain 4-like [Physcomitrium patens]XP_024378447.1 inter alpha-trypsin inhibitor, heavy chain 4-like [Physcomitrium patens]XP_024378448.1 inter alpha-trypsin inhibitor, heavy chain 4-like [Physcomitrium patens]PNR52975.1 hypothetical protein PHYPA_009350 [Physcomitrium patens]|eukprot:XP_024378444.1 inter alpha-trypsin inhibitor, heavy chain 4-like [Physcomitrella patens]
MDSGSGFVTSIAAGQILSQQLRHGGGVSAPSLGPPKHSTIPTMPEKKKMKGLPTCPMIYAIITDLNTFGNPKVDNAHGSLHPPTFRADAPPLPALVPLSLEMIELDVACHISTGFVTAKSRWNLNCVRSQASCDCLLALPMDHQGTVSSVEIDMGHGRFYTTVVVPSDEAASYGARGSPNAQINDPGTYNPELFRLNLPQVEGGTKLELKITWFQAMTFESGLYSLRVSFVFPEDIVPLGTNLASITKVKCMINTGTNDTVEVGSFGNQLKETFREPGIVAFENESNGDATDGKNQDFVASYQVWSDGIFPNLIFQDPEPGESDNRGSFCLSISPPDPSKITVFQRAVVFLLDRSGSMYGDPLNDALQALYSGLESLKPEDSFNIIAFDHETALFSSQMERANSASILRAREWATEKCKARGGTDILSPLQQAFKLVENFPGAVPYVFLITDGAVDNEKNICLTMQSRIVELGARAPRISTFGIGHYCNYYFLKMLAVIGRGLSDVAFASGKLRGQMERMLVAAATPVLTNIGLAGLPDGCEVYPFAIPDLFCGNPLVVSGKFHGSFPDTISFFGLMPDQSTWKTEVPSRKTSKVPLSKVFAKQQLDLLTGQAWLYGDKRRQQEAVNLSLATGMPCEYTRMIGFETTPEKYQEFQNERKKGKKLNIKKFTAGKVAGVVLVGGLAIGFGNVAATVANAAVGDLSLDSLGNFLGDFGGDSILCCCCNLEECESLSFLGSCFDCGEGCDGCGDILAGCGALLEGGCGFLFDCMCGLLTECG